MKKKIIMTIGFILTSLCMLIGISSILHIKNSNALDKEEVRNQLTADGDPVKLSDGFSVDITEYTIEDAADLIALFGLNEYDTSGMTFTLTANINMANTSIGSRLTTFSGVLDGDSHTISNLTFPSDSTNADDYYFIETLAPGGVIKNITFSDIESPEKENTTYSAGNNGSVFFIKTVADGATLYNATFTRISLGGTAINQVTDGYYDEAIITASGFDRAAIVGTNSGLISHCTVDSDYENSTDSALCAFIGLEYAAIWAAKSTSTGSFERNDAYYASVRGLKYIGGVVAYAEGSYITSNYLDFVTCHTLLESSLGNFSNGNVEGDYYTTAASVCLGGVVGYCNCASVIQNVFYGDNRNGSLYLSYTKDGETEPTVGELDGSINASSGTVKLGGIVGYIEDNLNQNASKVDYNLYWGTITLRYTEDMCSIYTSDSISAGDNVFVSSFVSEANSSVGNYVIFPCDDEPESNKYFVNIGTSSGDLKSGSDRIISYLFRATDAHGDISLYSDGNTKIFSTSDEALIAQAETREYKIFRFYFDPDVDQQRYFDEYSNQAVTFNFSNVTTGADATIAKGDLAFKIVYNSTPDGDSVTYTELGLCGWFVVDAENKIYAVEMPNAYSYYAELDNYVLLMYDGAASLDAKSSSEDYYNKYQIFDGYYLLGDDEEFSIIRELMGTTVDMYNLNYSYVTTNIQDSIDSDDVTAKLYAIVGDTNKEVAIFNRIWPSKTIVSPDGSNSYVPVISDYRAEMNLVSGYECKFEYKTSLLEDYTEGTDDDYGLLNESISDGLGIRYKFYLETETKNICVTMNSSLVSNTFGTAPTIGFYDLYDNEITSVAYTELRETNSSNYIMSITYSFLGLENYGDDIIVRLISTDQNTSLNISPLNTFVSSLDFEGVINVLVLKVTYEAAPEEGQEITLKKSSDIIPFVTSMDSQGIINSTAGYYYTTTTETVDGVEKTKYVSNSKYGIPFDVVNDVSYDEYVECQDLDTWEEFVEYYTLNDGTYTLVDTTTITNPAADATYYRKNDLGLFYDFSENTNSIKFPLDGDNIGYFFMDAGRYTTVLNYNYALTITISLETAYHRIHRLWNEGVQLEFGDEYYSNSIDDYLDELFYGSNSIGVDYGYQYGSSNLQYSPSTVGSIVTGYDTNKEQIECLVVGVDIYYYNYKNEKIIISDSDMRKIQDHDLYVEYKYAIPNTYTDATYTYTTMPLVGTMHYNDDSNNQVATNTNANGGTYNWENYIYFQFSTSASYNDGDGTSALGILNNTLYYYASDNIANEYLWALGNRLNISLTMPTPNTSDESYTFEIFEIDFGNKDSSRAYTCLKTIDGVAKALYNPTDSSANYSFYVLKGSKLAFEFNSLTGYGGEVDETYTVTLEEYSGSSSKYYNDTFSIDYVNSVYRFYLGVTPKVHYINYYWNESFSAYLDLDDTNMNYSNTSFSSDFINGLGYANDFLIEKGFLLDSDERYFTFYSVTTGGLLEAGNPSDLPALVINTTYYKTYDSSSGEFSDEFTPKLLGSDEGLAPSELTDDIYVVFELAFDSTVTTATKKYTRVYCPADISIDGVAKSFSYKISGSSTDANVEHSAIIYTGGNSAPYYYYSATPVYLWVETGIDNEAVYIKVNPSKTYSTSLTYSFYSVDFTINDSLSNINYTAKEEFSGSNLLEDEEYTFTIAQDTTYYIQSDSTLVISNDLSDKRGIDFTVSDGTTTYSENDSYEIEIEITASNTYTITTDYIVYTVIYSWSSGDVTGQINFSGTLYESFEQTFTFDTTNTYNFAFTSGNLVTFIPTGQTDSIQALVTKIVYVNSDTNEALDVAPTLPYEGNLTATMTLALSEQVNGEGLVYSTKTVGTIAKDGTTVNTYDFIYSSSDAQITAAQDSATYLEHGTSSTSLYYYSPANSTDTLLLKCGETGSEYYVIVKEDWLSSTSNDINIYTVSVSLDADFVEEFNNSTDYKYLSGYTVSGGTLEATYEVDADAHSTYIMDGNTLTVSFGYITTNINGGDDGYEIVSATSDYTISDNQFNQIITADSVKTYAFSLMRDAKYYTVYYYYTDADEGMALGQNILENSILEGNLSGRQYVTSEQVQFGEALPEYPLSQLGYRVTGSYIYSTTGSTEITESTTMDKYNCAVYATWAEAGKASFDVYFYTEAENVCISTSYPASTESSNAAKDYAVKLINADTEEELTKVDINTSTLAENEYKLAVEEKYDDNNNIYYSITVYFYEDIDESNIKVYILTPISQPTFDISEYVYYTTLSKSDGETKLYNLTVNALNQDSTDVESHISIIGEGWQVSTNQMTLYLELEDEYTASFTSTNVARVINIINNKIIFGSMDDFLTQNNDSLTVDLTITLKTYFIYYYLDGNLIKWEEKAKGEEVTLYEPTDELMGQRWTGWNRTDIETMPGENVTLYGETIAGNTKTITLDWNYTGDITKAFFIADNKEEINGKTVITYATVEENKITVTYKDQAPYLWMQDPITMEYRYLDLDLNSVESISLIEYSVSDCSHLSITNLGYQLANTIVSFDVNPDSGYTFTTEETMNGNSILVSGKTEDYELKITEALKTYSIEYYIESTLVHTDTLEYLAPVTLWTYDPTTYNGSFNFESWSIEELEYMPAYDVIIYGQEMASFTLTKNPTITTIHENDTLATATFTGGEVQCDGVIIPGTYSFKNPDTVVYKSDSLVTEFTVVFRPEDTSLVPFEFEMMVTVCNPKYNGVLDDVYIISRTDTSLNIHINENYEFYVGDSNTFEEGRNLLLTGLIPNTYYTITYRYKEDENYCASEIQQFKVRTYSKDEMLYFNSQEEGLSFINEMTSFIDNRVLQQYLSFFQAHLSQEYAAEMNGSEVEAYVNRIITVFGFFVEIEESRAFALNLNVERSQGYVDHVLEEMAKLAFEDDEDANDLNRYKVYAIRALLQSNNIIVFFNVTMEDLLSANTGEVNTLTALTNEPVAMMQDQSNFVITKVDELLTYNYSNYSHVDLEEYQNGYIGGTVDLMNTLAKNQHHTDSEMVTNAINKCVSAVQYQTYEDYTFNREEYDALFFKAAEAAVVAHMQVIVLNNLEESYEIKAALIRDINKILRLNNIYLGLVDEYSDFDTFYLEYREMIEAGNNMTYDDCIHTFTEELDAKLVVPANSGLTSSEVIILFVFVSAVLVVLAVIVIKYVVKRRMTYAGSRK